MREKDGNQPTFGCIYMSSGVRYCKFKRFPVQIEAIAFPFCAKQFRKKHWFGIILPLLLNILNHFLIWRSYLSNTTKQTASSTFN